MDENQVSGRRVYIADSTDVSAVQRAVWPHWAKMVMPLSSSY